MYSKRFLSLSAVCLFAAALVLSLALALNIDSASTQEAEEDTQESQKALLAEQQPTQSKRDGNTFPALNLQDHPLFAGLDDVTLPAYRIEPLTGDAIQVFIGYEVWGAAYDYFNDQVYFSDGVDLYVWPIGGSVTFLATVSDTTGTTVSMEGLAFYDGHLYASKVSTTGEGEGIYEIDTSTYQATRVIAYVDGASATISGIDIDPATGNLYGTNDATALRGLVQINSDGTINVVAPYLGGETDVDGLAVGDNKAYLITDDPTPPTWDVFDFGVMTYTGVVSSPFSTTEVYAAGAFIAPFGANEIVCNGPAATFAEGMPSTWITATTTGPVYWTTTDDAGGCSNPYEAGSMPPGACADANTTNPTGLAYDTEMWTNSFSLVGEPHPSLDLQWRHNQLNNSVFDIDISIDGGTSWTNVMNNTTGNPSGAAGDFASINLSAFAGEPDVIARFRYHGDAMDWYSQVDDVRLSCLQPEVSMSKTVGTDPLACSPGDTVYVSAGTDVYYCYEATNSGTFTLTTHDLDDSELGSILTSFPFTLTPGASVFVTVGATINTSTVNTATWTAFNPGPSDVVTATDTATVNIIDSAPFPTCVDFEAGSLPSFAYPISTSSGAANGRVQVTTAFPHTGVYGVDIDTDCDGCGGSTLQGLVLQYDLAGQTNVELDFWVHEHGDENNPEDGVFISDDGGATWAPIFSLNNFPSNYENVILDLDAAATNAGMSMVDGFQIKFQSLDNFTLSSDGYSFDDICVKENVPEISLNKTVGTDPTVCAPTDAIDVPVGTEVSYCYEVTNTGNFTLTMHDLDDSELGNILTAFPFTLTPGASTFLTQTAVINVNTVNTATWMAYNLGPTDIATATDSASVTVFLSPEIDVNPTSLSSTQDPDMTVTQTLTVSNLGDGDLNWEIFEELPVTLPPAVPYIPSDEPEPVVTSEEDCALYENYAGREPDGYAEFCGTSPESLAPVVVQRDPTDTGYVDDIRNDRFASHLLNDFQGQTTLGSTSLNIYAMDFEASATVLYAIDDTSSQLGTFNLANGAFTPIGSITKLAGHTWTGLTIHPLTNEAYASSTDGVTAALYSVDLSVPSATLIGTDATVPFLIDIAINADGAMYGHDISTDSIYTINTSTGQATLVGLTGVNSNFAQGLDFDSADGTLYAYTYQGTGANQYGTINLATGLLTPLAINDPLGEYEGATQTQATGCGDDDISWISVNPTSGTIASGGSTDLVVTFDSTGLSTGVYTGTLCVESNDPINPAVRVPVEMEVTGAAAIDVSPDSIAVTLNQNTTGQETLDISNIGQLDLDWTIDEATPGNCTTPTDTTWLEVAPDSGTTSPGGTTSVVVNFDASGLAPNTYSADLCISSNDLANPLVTVPVTLIVEPHVTNVPIIINSTSQFAENNASNAAIMAGVLAMPLAAGILLLPRSRRTRSQGKKQL